MDESVTTHRLKSPDNIKLRFTWEKEDKELSSVHAQLQVGDAI